METTERLWSVTEAAWAVGMTRCGIQKAIDRCHVSPAEFGTTRTGGYRYRESDLVRLFGERFRRERLHELFKSGRCKSCHKESKVENFETTHGLCLDCWCRELNQFLIGRRMSLEDATKETVKSLKAKGIL